MLHAAAERRQLLFLALTVLLPFALLAVWARFWSPAPWETDVLGALAAPVGAIGTISGALNALGNLPVWALVVGATAIAFGVLRGAAAAALVGLTFASDLAAFVVKLLVERDRPETAAVEQIFGFDSFSYPSGHTVRAATLVAVLFWIAAPPRWRVAAAVGGGLVAGIVMGYARVSLGVHWPTDTIGGTLLGLGWFAITAAILLPKLAAPGSRIPSR